MERNIQPTSARRLWLRRFLADLALVMLGASAGAGWQAIATRRFEQQHPPPGRLVDVGGHRLHLRVGGSGSPTVVIEAGFVWRVVRLEDGCRRDRQVCSSLHV